MLRGVRSPRHRCLAALIAGLVVVLCAPLAWSGQSRPVNLEELTLHAERIVVARCVERHVAWNADLRRHVTEWTFEVTRSLKGDAGPTVTVRALGDAAAGGGTPGLPRYRPGDEYLLFLHGESASGLSSPVGFGQGKFGVVRDKNGQALAINELANKGLLRDLSQRARQRIGAPAMRWAGKRAVPVEALLEMVGALLDDAPGDAGGP